MRLAPERGGLLLSIVAAVAIATFGYIAAVLFVDPQKADTVSDGVEEATEGDANEPITPTEAEADPAAQAIYDRYVELGYPSVSDMPEDFTQQILDAWANDDITQVQYEPYNETDFAVIAGVTDYGYCGGYGQELCFVLIGDDNVTYVAMVIDAIRESPNFTMENAKLEGFLGNNRFLVTRAFGDAGTFWEKGYAVDYTTGEATEIAELKFEGDPGPFRVAYTDSALGFAVEDKGEEVAGDITIYNKTVTVSDTKGDLMTIEGSYNPYTEELIDIDFARTYTYQFDYDPEIYGYDPLREVMPYNEKGLYVWILGKLYYYDPETRTFAVTMDAVP